MISMKPITSSQKLKTTIKRTAPFAIFGTAVAAVLSNPITWGALAIGLYKIGKNNYKALESTDMLGAEDENLFI